MSGALTTGRAIPVGPRRGAKIVPGFLAAVSLVKGISWPILFIALVPLAVLASACFGASQEGSLESRAQALDKRLICPVCPGETIDQSQVELAKQMRALVREMLAEGATDEQVLDFFQERYGPSVLAAPPKHGFNLAAWLVPPIAAVGGGLLMLLVLREMRRRKEEPALAGPALGPEELAPYLAQVDEELAHMEAVNKTQQAPGLEETAPEKPAKGEEA